MEIGNLLFGHSRGQFEIERHAGFENELERLFEAYAPKRDNSWREYGEEFTNEIFEVHPYYWGDCTCGFSERWQKKDEEWCKINIHSADCYQTELQFELEKYKEGSGYNKIEFAAFGKDKSIFSGFDTKVENNNGIISAVGVARKDDAMEKWREAYKKKQEFENKLFDRLCKKYNVSREFGFGVHCTCDYEQKRIAWCETDDHDLRCPIVIANFIYKPLNYEIRWYKYPLRDSYQNQELTLEQFKEIIDICIASVTVAQS